MVVFLFLFWVRTPEKGGGGYCQLPLSQSDAGLCVLMQAVYSSDWAARRDRGTKHYSLENMQHWSEAD